MTRPRSRAYARVQMTLRDLGPAKLQSSEQARIRHAADTLLFCADIVDDPSAREALLDMHDLYDHLVASGRWSEERAGQLLDELWTCGPLAHEPLAVAA